MEPARRVTKPRCAVVNNLGTSYARTVAFGGVDFSYSIRALFLVGDNSARPFRQSVSFIDSVPESIHHLNSMIHMYISRRRTRLPDNSRSGFYVQEIVPLLAFLELAIRKT